MSQIALGTFTPPASGGKSSTYKPQENVNRPILAVPRELKTDFVTPTYPEPKDVVIYDVVDLLTGNIFPNVITGSGAMVDNLRLYVPGGKENPGDQPTVLAVKIVQQTGGRGQTYYKFEQLEGKELKLAGMWDSKFGLSEIDSKRTEFAAQAATPKNDVPPWMVASDIATAGGTSPVTVASDSITALKSTEKAPIDDDDIQKMIDSL